MAGYKSDRIDLDKWDNVSPERLEQLRSTHKLWHERTEVMVPLYAAHTPESIKLYGMAYTEGLTNEERAAQNNSMVKTWMAPIRHIRLFHEGVPIAYPNRARAAKIYFYIKNHIATWSELLQGSMNARSKAPPMEDFDMMLEFAENLEKFLVFYYNSDKSDAVFSKANMNRFAQGEGRYFNPESTYSKLREGVFGLMTNRTDRNDSPNAKMTGLQVNQSSSDDFSSLDAAFENVRNQ